MERLIASLEMDRRYLEGKEQELSARMEWCREKIAELQLAGQ